MTHQDRFRAGAMQLKSGRIVNCSGAIDEMGKARTSLERWTYRALLLAPHDDPELTDYHLETLEWELDKLAELIGWWRTELARQRGDARQRDKIAKLRNTSGRTAPEAETALVLADRLERKLGA